MSHHGGLIELDSQHSTRRHDPVADDVTRFAAQPSSSTTPADEFSQPYLTHLASESATNGSALPPADKGIQAWSFLVAAFLVEAIVWSFPFAYGVFLESYLNDPVYSSQTHATTLLPFIGTISSGIMFCSGVVLYPIIVRYPRMRRPSVWIGAVLCAASLFGASYTRQIPLLFGLQGVLYAVGGSFLYFPTIFYMNEWFIRLRGTASGIVFAGTAAGGLILPLAFPVLIDKYGAAKSLRIYSIAIACMLFPVLPWIRGRLPHTRAHGPAPRAGNRQWMKNPSWWLYTTVNLVQSFGYFMPIVWLPTFASELSLSAVQSAAALAALNGASVVGGLVMGCLSDHFNTWLLTLGSLVLTVLATFILWGIFGNTFAGLIAFGLAYGIVAGCWSSLWMSFARSYAKEDPGLSTTLFGYICLGRGIGNVMSTPIATALVGAKSYAMASTTGFAVGGGRFENMIIYSGTCFVVSTGLSVFGWRLDLWSFRRQ
ncbi:major facilitator superfamily domain-containing protein [Schizophyllum amplum]|uniref:Major facilitator superfamily domain-containing protein n=1 Tax=Schizophyllum amplum TaxID=97359 RepID=A0A550CX46_9AGAR|nr:major facilitator superfamily domain-containing protein [Auriculariopsis ampla]